jgi:hypothetical protein
MRYRVLYVARYGGVVDQIIFGSTVPIVTVPGTYSMPVLVQ